MVKGKEKGRTGKAVFIKIKDNVVGILFLPVQHNISTGQYTLSQIGHLKGKALKKKQKYKKIKQYQAAF